MSAKRGLQENKRATDNSSQKCDFEEKQQNNRLARKRKKPIEVNEKRKIIKTINSRKKKSWIPGMK